MSILDNFVNPWESSEALGSRALEENVLATNTNTENINFLNTIVPTAYILPTNDALTPKELNNTKQEVKIISKVEILKREKRGFGKYDLAIGIVNNYGDSIGHSDFLKHYETNPNDRPLSRKPSKLESILQKHSDLIRFYKT